MKKSTSKIKMEIELLRNEGTPENVIEHSKAVCRKAMKIAANFDNADKDLIKKALCCMI